MPSNFNTDFHGLDLALPTLSSLANAAAAGRGRWAQG